jgi:uncharacterized membrane protein
MVTQATLSGPAMFVGSVHYTLRSVPITCFSLALASDFFYLQTSNLLWLHFSEWLLLASVVFGTIAILVAFVDFLIRRIRPSWAAVLLSVVVLMTATVSNLVHTADGGTAVYPMGLALSIATVLAIHASLVVSTAASLVACSDSSFDTATQIGRSRAASAVTALAA